MTWRAGGAVHERVQLVGFEAQDGTCLALLRPDLLGRHGRRYVHAAATTRCSTNRASAQDVHVRPLGGRRNVQRGREVRGPARC